MRDSAIRVRQHGVGCWNYEWLVYCVRWYYSPWSALKQGIVALRCEKKNIFFVLAKRTTSM